jgi:predicted dienelactone hydrolase
MRPLEIVLVALLAVSAVATLTGAPSRRLLSWLCVLDLLSLASHAIFEGPHWQLIPAYAAALLFPLALAWRSAWRRRALGAVMLLFLLAAGTASAIVPMFRLPAPTGPDLIGTRIFHLVNHHPLDPASADSTGKRELMIQVWYPALPSHAPRAAYRRLVETTGRSTYQAVLKTHARWNARFAPGASPMLLLNPSSNGRRTYYMYLVEDLVSHGYIVVGIDHTGNSGPTAFPDGHISQPIADPAWNFTTLNFDQIMAYGTRLQEVQVNDDRFVLDQLQSWNQDSASPFYHHIDMDRVGALGHSLGGSVAAQACYEDPRIKSALDMDGSFWGPVRLSGLAKPLMMMEEDLAHFTSEQQDGHPALMNYYLDQGDAAMMRKSNGYHITLHGSSHTSYTDQSLYSPIKRYSGAGSIEPYREYAIIRAYVLAFFDKTLRGADPPLLRTTRQPYPESTLEILHRPD